RPKPPARRPPSRSNRRWPARASTTCRPPRVPSMPDVVIVHSGVANLASITSAFHRLGTSVVVTDDPGVVAAARRVVLPGVGAFGAGLAALRARGLDRAIAEAVARGTPLLGVCLGMQMLRAGGEEAARVAGVGESAGRGRRRPDRDDAPRARV